MKFNNYDEYFKVYRDTPLRWEFWVEVLHRYKRKGKLLEIGCAEGYFLKRAKKYYDVFGVDISADCIKKLKRTGFKQTFCLSAQNLQRFRKNYFDIVVIFDVLEHLKNPKLCIKKVSRVIKQDGILIVSVPNTRSIGRIIKKKNWFAVADTTHISLLKLKEWMDLLTMHNFQIIKKASDGFWDIPYFSFLPLVMQKVFLLPGYLQYKLKKLIIPALGENLIIVAEKIK